MKRRYYLDTSVFGGVFDEEFKESSIQLFEQVKRGKVVCLYSDVVDAELINAPSRVKTFVKSLAPESFEKITITPAAEELAVKYISEMVIGKASYEDCLHIAFATLHQADALISWNFKHIVNIGRMAGYNSVNLKMGYTSLEICSPKQIIAI